jgi:hypothetical protein
LLIQGRNPNPCDFPRCLQFVLFEVLPVALGKSKDEYGAVAPSESNHRTIPTGSPFSLPSDTLVDQPAAQIRVNQAPLCPLDCLPQTGVSDSLTPGKPREPPRFENLHGPT